MPTTDRPPITVTDGRSVAPVEVRRLFQLERSFDPPLVDLSAPIRTHVRLNLPDNRSGQGPRISRTGDVTMVIHASGCRLSGCSGPPDDCMAVGSVDDMSVEQLRARIDGLRYFGRTHERRATPDPVADARLAELAILMAALALREPAEAVNA
jgi:hypothetical protein